MGEMKTGKKDGEEVESKIVQGTDNGYRENTKCTVLRAFLSEIETSTYNATNEMIKNTNMSNLDFFNEFHNL